MKSKILDEFEKKRVIFIEYEQKIKELITYLVKENSIEVHAIDSRVKEMESLKNKIEKKDGKYSSLDDITDTVGLRIITYFEDDVDKIADILKQQFYLNEMHSIDKRKRNKPEDFGYSSLHFVLKLMEPRASLPEYERFKEINFEIQIRSILQHAWAEIEHDLGYKSKNELPFEIRRDFSRIAGLLELADMEFLRIKEFLIDYTMSVEENFNKNDLDIPIDKITLTEFLKKDSIVQELDSIISQELKSKLSWENYAIEGDLKRLKYFNITRISELKDQLVRNKEKIIDFCKEWLKKPDEYEDEYGTVTVGISFFYLAYILLGESLDEKIALDYFKNFSIGTDYLGDSKKVISTYKKIKS